MKFLIKKMIRSIIQQWSQFLAVFLMAFLCMLVYSGLEGAWHGMEVEINRYIEETNLADEWVYATAFTPEDLCAIEQIEGVEEVALKTWIDTTVKVTNHHNSYLSLTTIGEKEISVPHLEQGVTVSENVKDGIWLDANYVEENNIQVGDSIEITYGSVQTKLTVAGVIISSDKIQYSGVSEFLAPQPDYYGYGIISKYTLEEKFGYRYPGNLLEMKSKDSAVRDEIRGILNERYIAYYSRDTLPEVSTALERVVQLKSVSILFSTFFLMLSILSMNTTIKRLIDSQAMDIVTLKAIGYTNKKLKLYYASYGLFLGALGGGLGISCAPLLSSFILQTQKVPFRLPHWSYVYRWMTIVVLIAIIVICTIAAYITSAKSCKGLPCHAMQNTSKKGCHIVLERMEKLWDHITFGSRWTWRDALSHKARIYMGIVSVSGCMMILMASFGSPDAIKALVTDTLMNDFTYSYRAKVNALNTEEENDSLAKEYKGQLIETVQTRITPDDGKERVLTIFSQGDYIGIRTTDQKAMTDGGAYVTEGAANCLEIKIGDTIKVTAPLDTNVYEFTVEGILPSSTPQGVYLTERTWVDAGGSFRPSHMMLGKNTDIATLQSDDRITQVMTMRVQMDNVEKFNDAIMGTFYLMRMFAIVLAVVVLYNISTLSFTERTRDYMTLRVLGLHNKEIRALTMKENLFTTLIGFVIGIPAGFKFLEIYCNTFTTTSLVYYPSITVTSLVIVYTLTLVSSMTTTILLTRRIKKIDMVQATKGIE